jgi:hypothetical protein
MESKETQDWTAKRCASLVNSDKFSDVKLLLDDGEEVPAHRFALVTKSRYFAAMFDSGMQESKAAEIAVPGVEKASLIAVLEYIYCGKTQSVSAENCLEVLHLASQYMLDGLVTECAALMNAFLDAANCLDFVAALSPHVRPDDDRHSTRVTYRCLVLYCQACVESRLVAAPSWTNCC